MYRLLDDYQDVLSKDPSRNADVDPVNIVSTAPYPLAQSPYHIPPKKINAVKEEIQDLLRLGIIRESKSPWASPAVIVMKPNGRIRLYVNYQRLNATTVPDNFPIPNIEMLLQKASSCAYISTIDLSKGFHQVPVMEESIPLTSFILPFGKYEYTKMPFGIRNGPSHFQRITTQLLANTDNADVYIDDIIVYSKTFSDHLIHLSSVFQLLRKHRLNAQPEKLILCKASLNFLGHTIGNGKISPQVAKVQSLKNYNLPKTKKGVRAFLGATGYYRKFIQSYSETASPLYQMTTKKAPDCPKWTSEGLEAFNKLKQALSSETFLIPANPDKPYILATDASTKAIGGVLSQQDDQGRERPIAYFSRKLKKYQMSYTITELELLAIVASVEHFSIFLIGSEFEIHTDHRALSFLNNLKTANPRLIRWNLYLQTFNYTVKYKKGTANGNADALSRQEFPPDPTNPGGLVSAYQGGVV